MWILGASFLICVGLASFVAGRAQERGRSPLAWAMLTLSCCAATTLSGAYLIGAAAEIEDAGIGILTVTLALMLPATPGVALAVVVGQMPPLARGKRLRGFLLTSGAGEARTGVLRADSGALVFEPADGTPITWQTQQVASLAVDGELVRIGTRDGGESSFRPEGENRDLRLKQAREFVRRATAA